MDKLFEQIAAKLIRYEGIKKVSQLGTVGDARDEWSDIDVGVLVEEKSLGKYYPITDWIGAFGDIFAVDQSSAPGKVTTRVVFRDLSRVDFIFATNEEMFTTSVTPPNDEKVRRTVDEIFNEFCFDVILAIAKFGRGDALIGMHLLLGLEQKCLVLAMMLRDQEHGTVHHSRGGFLNDVADRLSSNQRLDLSGRIRASCSLFGELAARLDSSREVDWSPIMEYLDLLENKSGGDSRVDA